MNNISIGIDIGSVQIKLVALDGVAGAGDPVLTMVDSHFGQIQRVTQEMFTKAIAMLGKELNYNLVLTGGKDLKGEVVVVNQVSATVNGIAEVDKTVKTVIDLGGQFSKLILIGNRHENGVPGIADFAVNGLCAAGSGVFLEQQASRLRLSVDELGLIAEQAEKGATIAGRCSVFAKSDMIHLQQIGTPIEEIAYGLCLALVRTFVSTVLEKRILEPPVALVGGGAANPGLIRAFCTILGLERHQFIIPDNYLYAGALGAAIEAEKLGDAKDSGHQLVTLAAMFESAQVNTICSRNDCGRLDPVGDKDLEIAATVSIKNKLQRQGKISVHLGIDVGSVSTKIVLLSREQEYLDGVYLATAGKPVAALDKALSTIDERYRGRLKILSVGATGSGRYLAGKLTGADLVKNEITAQLVSSAHFFPGVETVFEIGGQDAKFMSAVDGLLQDFEMNKICSAGTGSFLEEQAGRLGISIIDEFSDLALSSSRPVELGSRCTVFMDGELCHAMAGNHRVEDLCAGLALAVVRNYLEKVVSGRKIGSLIVFQGGTSANKAVVSAFRGVLGRPVKVHPYGRVSGAIGAALLAAKKVSLYPHRKSLFLGFSCCQNHKLNSFECRKCENHCQVNQIKVRGQKLHFGDVCERYSARDNRENVSIEESSLFGSQWFKARDDLLHRFLPEQRPDGRPQIGLVKASLMLEYLPFWSHLLDELGFHPVVTDGGVVDEHGAGIPAGVCLPQKLAAAGVHYLIHELQVTRVLMPSLLELESVHADDRAHTCIYSQQIPDMIGGSYGSRLLTPQLGLSADGNLRREGCRVLAELFEVSVGSVKTAWQKAMDRQGAFSQARQKLGRAAVENLGENGVVVIGKPYNLHDPRSNLNLARHFERLAVTAIPMDILPVSDEYLAPNWYMLPWLLNRNQLRALQLIADNSHLYPVHVSNYGCGPDAFTLKHLKKYWGARPRLFLEFDGHQGEAGLITRLEAFRDEIENYSARGKKTRVLQLPQLRDNLSVAPGTRFFLPFTSEHVHVYAGMLRREGFVTELLAPPDEESIRLGEEVCSGRECHPYTIIAGDLVKLTGFKTIHQGDCFFIPGTRLSCLISQYGDGFRHVLDELGDKRIRIFDQHPGEASAMFGNRGMIALYEGLTIIDYLIIASSYARPYEKHRGSVDLWLAQSCQQVQDCLAESDDKRSCLKRCLDEYDQILLQRRGGRPLIGITGDLYTRINQAGNGGLFARLEEMGCEVWASPFFAASTDFELPQNASRWLKRGGYYRGLSISGVASILKFRSKRLAACLDDRLKEFCVEPSEVTLRQYAKLYVQDNSNHLIRTMIAKMVDFSRRGADGVINVIGHNCMAGTAAAAVIQQIRSDHGGIPIISIAYGGTEGPAQRMQLETFVDQVGKRRDRQMSVTLTLGCK